MSYTIHAGGAPPHEQSSRLLFAKCRFKPVPPKNHMLQHSGLGLCSWLGGCSPLCLDVLDGSLDGILGQHAAVQLHRRQAQVLCDLTVLDLHHVLDRASLDPFCCDRAAGDGRAAAKGLEARVCDVAVLIHLDLKLHHIPTGRCTHKACTNILVTPLERPYVPGVLVVIHHILVVRSQTSWQRGQQGSGRGESTPCQTSYGRGHDRQHGVYIIEFDSLYKCYCFFGAL
mmetsp:Transcript_18364/g.47891  ORF Transcript_18364/g.47891 Transcript_18364/m.47891 type:complete len:228 (+) Transcript_18364:265-948(+)